MLWPNGKSVPLTALARRLAQDIGSPESYIPHREKNGEIASLKARVAKLESQRSSQPGQKDSFSWIKKPLERVFQEIVKFLMRWFIKWLHQI